jgi:hypothetical protein
MRITHTSPMMQQSCYSLHLSTSVSTHMQFLIEMFDFIC